jgi:LemA protein
MTPLYIFIGIAVVLVLIVVGMYNGLVRARLHVKEAWADIDVQLKRRFDLIPNLVNTIKGSTNFESSTLEKVVEARAKAMQAGTPAEHGEAENMLTGALKSVFALAESYPDLKSNQNFLSLQTELADTENKIQAARRFYNGNVRDFNTKVQVFPTNIIAKKLGFSAKSFFEIEEVAQRENIKVKF